MPAPEIKSYEAHVTIEPVFDERFELFDRICALHKFRPAELLLQKSRMSTPTRSNKDSFCTGHGTDYPEVQNRLALLVADLKRQNFSVWRHKIEGILLDVRTPPLVTIRTFNEDRRPV